MWLLQWARAVIPMLLLLLLLALPICFLLLGGFLA
jgi:hypothetical protein